MASYNKIVIVGRLGQDPDSKFTPGGKQTTKMSVATDRKFTNAAGEKVEQTDWHNVVTWGKLAEVCNNYLAKGRLVLVEGRQTNRKYEDQSGATKYYSEIVADTVLFLDKGSEQAIAAAEEDSLDFETA